MKLVEILPKYAKQYQITGPQTWLSDKEYRSVNAKKGGVIRWSYGTGKKVRNTV